MESRLKFCSGAVAMRSEKVAIRVLKPEAVVLLVRANPEPGDHVALAHTQRAVVIANTNDADAVPPLFEPQRRVIWIAPPERVFITRELLDTWWQRVEVLPETRVRFADHGKS